MMPFRPVAAPALCLLLVAATTLLPQCTGDAGAPQLQAVARSTTGTIGEPIRFLISGSMHGHLEPCGCASGQLGGLARRMQHIGERRSYDVLLEGGDLIESHTPLDVLKFLTEVQVLTGMQHPYDALGVGPKDLQLPLDDYMAFLAGAPVVAADLECSREDWPARPFVEKDVRGQLVRITGLALSLPANLQGADAPLQLLPPTEAWQRALAGVGDETLRVVMLQCTDTVARDLVPKLLPPPDLVVCCDEGHLEPGNQVERIGKVPMVFAGIRGRVLLEASLLRTPDGSEVAVELVPLAGSKTLPGGGGDPDVKAMLLAHRQQVADDKILERMARQQPTPNGAAYVGTETCRACHPTAYATWTNSKHAHAWETLEKAEVDPKRYGWPVTHYPDCVGCHVVGYREQTGFVSGADTPQLANVGCESCHGAGSNHIQNPAANKLGIHGGIHASERCVQCHDFEQSPEFIYGDRWKVIEHGREPK